MDLSPYLQRLAEDLEKVTALADDPTRAIATRLLAALEPGLRTVLVEAVSDTAAVVTADLDGVVAVVRMEGRDPVIAVERTDSSGPTMTIPAAEEGEEDSARITVRLPQSLKQRAEARAADADQSLNTWIVHAIRRATHEEAGPGFAFPGGPQRTSSRRVTGWA